MTQAQRTNGARYWLSSANSSNNVRSLSSSGSASYDYFTKLHLNGVRPVISLKPDTTISGSGTSGNPYIVQ